MSDPQIWMPHAAHFICGQWCQFHLATYSNGYIISTVGEYLPDAPVREILAKSKTITLEGIGDARVSDYMRKIGFEKIGADRLYETMVFKAKESVACDCCPWVPKDFRELDFAGYNNAAKAFRGHYLMCHKWSR